MDTHQDAVDFCLKEEQWVVGEGYKANNKKFIYSFTGDYVGGKPAEKSTRKKDDGKSSNFLSVITMTDDAITHRSRNVS